MDHLLPEEAVDTVAVVLGVAVAAPVVEHGVDPAVPAAAVGFDDDPFSREEDVDPVGDVRAPRQFVLDLEAGEARVAEEVDEAAFEDTLRDGVTGTALAEHSTEPGEAALAGTGQLRGEGEHVGDRAAAGEVGVVKRSLEAAWAGGGGEIAERTGDGGDREAVDGGDVRRSEVTGLVDLGIAPAAVRDRAVVVSVGGDDGDGAGREVQEAVEGGGRFVGDGGLGACVEVGEPQASVPGVRPAGQRVDAGRHLEPPPCREAAVDHVVVRPESNNLDAGEQAELAGSDLGNGSVEHAPNSTDGV